MSVILSSARVSKITAIRSIGTRPSSCSIPGAIVTDVDTTAAATVVAVDDSAVAIGGVGGAAVAAPGNVAVAAEASAAAADDDAGDCVCRTLLVPCVRLGTCVLRAITSFVFHCDGIWSCFTCVRLGISVMRAITSLVLHCDGI